MGHYPNPNPNSNKSGMGHCVRGTGHQVYTASGVLYHVHCVHARVLHQVYEPALR